MENKDIYTHNGKQYLTVRGFLKKNLSKVTLILAIIGVILSTIGLIVGSVGVHNSTQYNSFLKPDHTVVWGDTTIWADYFNDSGKKKMDLYFSNISKQQDDVKWDGKYLDGYFYN